MDNHNYLFKVIVTELGRRDADRQARGEAKKQEEKAAGEKQIAEAQKKLESRDEPTPQSRQPMPDNIKAVFNSILSRHKIETASLTPAELEQRKQDQLAQLEHLMTPQDKARRDAMKNQQHAIND